MGKKSKKEETESDTETDTDTETETTEKSTSFLSKLNNMSKKTKIYIGFIILLFVVAGYMWYRNRKQNQETQIVQDVNPQVAPSVPVVQNLQIPQNMQEIQLTQAQNNA